MQTENLCLDRKIRVNDTTDAFDRKTVVASVCWLMFYVKVEGSRVGSVLP